MEELVERCAGIDVGQAEVVATARSKTVPIKRFCSSCSRQQSGVPTRPRVRLTDLLCKSLAAVGSAYPGG
jgi:hypothetical protein